MKRIEEPGSRRRDRGSMVIACLFAQAWGASAQTPATSTYVYEYPYNTPDLIEDHFLVLEDAGSGPRGWYYGTSDEFDAAREGYLPGFFVAPMAGLTIAGDAISFTLNRPDRFFTSPVPLRYTRAEDAPVGLLDEWSVRVPMDTRQYRGVLRGDEIILEVSGSSRVFQRTQPGR